MQKNDETYLIHTYLSYYRISYFRYVMFKPSLRRNLGPRTLPRTTWLLLRERPMPTRMLWKRPELSWNKLTETEEFLNRYILTSTSHLNIYYDNKQKSREVPYGTIINLLAGSI